MKLRFKNLISGLLLTLLILIILEVLSTTLFPLVGLVKYRLSFSIMIILFLGFQVETPWLGFLILIIEYTHSFFSNEGWAMGTLAGVLVCTLISYVRDMIHFSTALATMVITQIFQFIWFLLVSGIIYFQSGNWPYLIEKFWHFLPESVAVSLLSPLFFALMERVWKTGGGDGLGESVA